MIKCDANKLPEDIKTKAREYVAKRKPRFRTFGIVSDDVECAWLNGFAFCLEGQVKVKVQQCATCVYADSPCEPSDYAKDNESVCNHYKNVLDAYAELKKENSKLSDKLTKAKELMRKLIANAPDTYSGTNMELHEPEKKIKE